MNELLNSALAHLNLTGKRTPDGRHIAWCPFHPDGQGTPPHQANLLVSDRGFICHACGAQGSLRDLAGRLEIPTSAAEVVYVYQDADGNDKFRIVRRAGKKFSVQHRNKSGGWSKGLGPAVRVIYRLPEILKSESNVPVFIVEGEKDADRLAANGRIATTNPFGAGKWRPEYNEPLRDRNVIIIPDNDEAGRNHAIVVAQSLTGVAKSIKVVALPDLDEKGDVSDWLNAGHTIEDLDRVVEASPVWTADEGEEASPMGVRDGDPKDLVRTLLDEGIELFHDQFKVPHARVPVDGHWENCALGDFGFKRWAALRYYERTGKMLQRDKFSAALLVLEAKAANEAPQRELHTRVANFEGAIWYDLSDRDWRCVRIAPDGWEVVSDPPILFRRWPHQQPQVEPVRGGSLGNIFNFLPLSRAEWETLLLPYLVACLVPDIPHPILATFGPNGAGKSTISRIFKILIDPSTLATLAFGTDQAGLVQQLSHHYYACYDNVSALPDWASDFLCRASTGEGFTKRGLYTNDEDFIYAYRRCASLNGLNLVVLKPDLLDRTILVHVEGIGKTERREEKEFWTQFESVRARLLGAVFDALSVAMKVKTAQKHKDLPRMADFAAWGAAAAEAIGIGSQTFLDHYARDEGARIEELICEDPLALAIVELVRARGSWSGLASELLKEVKRWGHMENADQHDARWPKTPNRLSARLNELQASLGKAGVEYRGRRTNQGKWIDLRPLDVPASPGTPGKDGDGLRGGSSPRTAGGSSLRNKLTGNVLSGNCGLSDDDDDPSAPTGGSASRSDSPRMGALGN